MYELAQLHDWRIVRENLCVLWDPLHWVWVHNSNICLSHCTLIPWPSTWVPGPLWNGLTYSQLTPPSPLGTRLHGKRRFKSFWLSAGESSQCVSRVSFSTIWSIEARNQSVLRLEAGGTQESFASINFFGGGQQVEVTHMQEVEWCHMGHEQLGQSKINHCWLR